MPVITGVPNGALNTGKDVSIDVALQDGRILRLGNVTSFARKPKVKKLTSLGIDGVPRNAVLPEGWDLDIEIDRQDSEIDDWWANYEADYYAGRTVRNLIITETIIEVDGSLSQYRYEGVALQLNSAGDFKSDSFVKMKLTGEAAFRKKVV